MPEIENIQEESQEDRESESPKEVNENISQEQTIEQPQTINQTSDIDKSYIIFYAKKLFQNRASKFKKTQGQFIHKYCRSYCWLCCILIDIPGCSIRRKF